MIIKCKNKFFQKKLAPGEIRTKKKKKVRYTGRAFRKTTLDNQSEIVHVR